MIKHNTFLAECPANSCRRGQIGVNVMYTPSLSAVSTLEERMGEITAWEGPA